MSEKFKGVHGNTPSGGPTHPTKPPVGDLESTENQLELLYNIICALRVKFGITIDEIFDIYGGEIKTGDAADIRKAILGNNDIINSKTLTERLLTVGLSINNIARAYSKSALEVEENIKNREWLYNTERIKQSKVHMKALVSEMLEKDINIATMRDVLDIRLSDIYDALDEITEDNKYSRKFYKTLNVR